MVNLAWWFLIKNAALQRRTMQFAFGLAIISYVKHIFCWHHQHNCTATVDTVYQVRFSMSRMFMKPGKAKKSHTNPGKKREFCAQDTKYVKNLPWFRFGVEPEELSDVAENKYCKSYKDCCWPTTLERKAGVKMNEWKNWKGNLCQCIFDLVT